MAKNKNMNASQPKTRKQGKGMLEVPWLAVNPENDSLLHG